jgi:uncharacterized protein YjdB
MMKNIFSKIAVAVTLMVVSLALGGCSNEDNYWTEAVTISGTGVAHHEVTMELGQTLQLEAKTGILVDGKTFEWTSSNPEVATIDQNGLVRAVSLGFTTITARAINIDSSYTGQIILYVANASIGLVDDRLDQSEAE